jgi:hypothetical protein
MAALAVDERMLTCFPTEPSLVPITLPSNGHFLSKPIGALEHSLYVHSVELRGGRFEMLYI